MMDVVYFMSFVLLLIAFLSVLAGFFGKTGGIAGEDDQLE